MSHVSVVKTTIRSLDILAQAARDCGMQLNLGQKEFKAYYRGEGGGCQHAIVCPDLPQAYSIGVVQAGDGWELKFDSFCGGAGLINRCGDGADVECALPAPCGFAPENGLWRQGKELAEGGGKVETEN